MSMSSFAQYKRWKINPTPFTVMVTQHQTNKSTQRQDQYRVWVHTGKQSVRAAAYMFNIIPGLSFTNLQFIPNVHGGGRRGLTIGIHVSCTMYTLIWRVRYYVTTSDEFINFCGSDSLIRYTETLLNELARLWCACGCIIYMRREWANALACRMIWWFVKKFAY